MLQVKIKENSWLARVAALKFGSRPIAIVVGKTIHLHKKSAKDFVQETKWLKHELKHIEQFRQFGIIRFLCMYTLEWTKNGYYNNKFEQEARAAENEATPEWETV